MEARNQRRGESVIDTQFELDYAQTKQLSKIIQSIKNNAALEANVDRVIIGSTELLENAMKYSRSGPIEYELRVDEENRCFLVIVRNLTVCAELRQFLGIHAEIYSDTAVAAYQKIALAALEKEGRTRLGLARLRYELHGEISCRYRFNTDKELEAAQDTDLVFLVVTLNIPFEEQRTGESPATTRAGSAATGLSIEEQRFDEVLLQADGETVFMSGKIRDQYPEEFLNPFLSRVFNQAAEMDRIIFDLRELDYINSSAIGCILRNLKTKAEALEIVIKTDPGKIWQETSVKIFRMIDPEHIRLE